MPEPHKQPTPEELKAQEDEAIKLAEEIEKNGVPVEKEEEPEIEPEIEEPVIPEPLKEEDKPEEKKEEEEQAEPSKEKQAEIDRLKKENSASAREAQKIHAKNRVINKALIDAEETPDPTEEELAAEYPDWDVMGETERKFAKETVISRNWRQTISKAKEQATKIEKWTESVEEYIDDPKTLIDNPDLEGKAEAFKTFATQESSNSVPFKILVSAFLHEHIASKVPNKGKMFENGSGGPNDKPKPSNGKISLEVSRKLRVTDYAKWKEYNAKGLIDYDL